MHANPAVIEIDNDTTPGMPRFAPPDEGLSTFLSARSRLFGIAYRMLGSAAEAEDIVQDVWVRWQTTDRGSVRNPVAFLVTATTRLAINVLQSARTRRETSLGTSLPEPVDTSIDPGLGTERNRGRGPCGAASAGEAHANRARGVPVSRGLQLSLSGDCRHPSGRRSQRAAARHQSAGACVERTVRACEFDRAATPAQCVRCRCEDGRSREAREPVRL